MPHRNTLGASGLLAVVLFGLGSGLLAQREPQPRESPRGNPAPASRPPAAVEGDVAVFFSPDGGATAAIVREIGAARKTLDVQAYLLTTREIAGAIARAHERGVKVRVVMDDDNAGDQYSAATYLANAAVSVWLDGRHKEAHNKVMLIDGHTIITGSFNFTRAAEEENAENLLVIGRKPKLFAAYQENFDAHLKHSRPYRSSGGRESKPKPSSPSRAAPPTR